MPRIDLRYSDAMSVIECDCIGGINHRAAIS